MTKSQVAPALLHLDKIIGAANFKQFIHAKDSVVLLSSWNSPMKEVLLGALEEKVMLRQVVSFSWSHSWEVAETGLSDHKGPAPLISLCLSSRFSGLWVMSILPQPWSLFSSTEGCAHQQAGSVSAGAWVQSSDFPQLKTPLSWNDYESQWWESSGWAKGDGNGNPFQYSCLENPMDGGAW